MNGTGTLWRTRWAAIGAAVAVTLGAGGLATTFADSAASSFVAITPVRVLDTRESGFGGALQANTPRTLQVTGTIPTIGADGRTVTNALVVPAGATAIVANVTAVSPTTGGFVSVRPGTATGTPTTSNINFTAGGVVVPNSVTVEVPTTGPSAGQIQLFFGSGAGATTELLVDIVGYYQAGGSGTPGPAGPAGPRGFSAWDTIPSGQTVTGDASFDTNGAGGPPYFEDGYSIPFPFTTSADLSNADVGFGAGAGVAVAPSEVIPTCTGSYLTPTAPPGKLCIYVISTQGMTLVRGDALDYQSRRGFFVAYTIEENVGQAPEQVYMYAVWAYTAP